MPAPVIANAPKFIISLKTSKLYWSPELLEPQFYIHGHLWPHLCKFLATPRPATQRPGRVQYVDIADILALLEELSKVCRPPDDQMIVCRPCYHKIMRESHICPCESLGRFT